MFDIEWVAEPDEIRTRFEKLAPFLDERMRRLVAASESLAIGFGGTSVTLRQTGVSRRATGLERLVGTGHARRSRIGSALDLQERA